jgi:predicted N-acetyltransferase YhbS
VGRSSVRVRPVELADVAGLTALTASFEVNGVISGRVAAEQSPEHVAARFTDLIETDARTMLVAVDDHDGVVGLLVARRDDIGAIDLTPVLHVSHLMVAPAWRRRGVGRQLLGAAVHVADELGVSHVMASAGSGSREANRYLSRLGFAPLVTHRIASSAVLRRSLGMADAPARIAVLRRARVARGRRGLAVARSVSRGA